MPSGTSFAYQSNLTWTQAKTRVARSAAASSEADQLVAAGYALEDAIREWENSRDWKYLLTNASITFVVDTADYRLPALYKSPYDCRVTSATGYRVLRFIPRVKYDNLESNQASSGYTTHYTLSNWNDGSVDGAQGTITFLPTPSVADTVMLRYFRRHTIPAAISTGLTTNDADLIDFPIIFQSALVSLAKTFYLADKGGYGERLDFWIKAAERMRMRAVGQDENFPDDGMGFFPSSIGPLYNPNSVQQYIDY